MTYTDGNVVQVQQSYSEEHGHADMIVAVGNADFTSLLPDKVIDFILPSFFDVG